MAEFKVNTGSSYDVIIIGAGMCGISCGAGLKTFGINDFIILEKGNTINNFWKNHTYDRMSLHTPWHDLPYDGGLVYNYPQMKNKHQLTDYLQKYAIKYHLNSHIKFHQEVININKNNTNNKWTIKTQSGEYYYSNYLCMATSMLREPNIPRSLRETMHNFNTKNGIIHSMEFKNGLKYKNENVLVVGNGDSAFEIAVDLVSHNANKITLISPIGRHVVKLSDLNRRLYKLFGFAKKLGIIDIIMPNVFKLTPKHSKWNIDIISYVFTELDLLSIDLTQYGIPKPKDSVFKCNVYGNLQVLDWNGNDSCVDLIKTKRINCIYDWVMQFDKPNIIKIGTNDNYKILNDYNSVILCTGYKHGLQNIFDANLFNELFEQSNICKNWGIVPKTNGLNQSIIDNTLFFLGLLGDFSVLSGFANGYWGWEVARTIAKQKHIYKWRNEPSTWNKYTFKRMTMFVVSVTSLLSVASYYGFKAYKKYANKDQ